MISAQTVPGVARLRAWMANHGVDAAYITNPISIAYLTGFHADPMERLMALAIRPGGATLIVPALEREQAVKTASDAGVVSWKDGEDPYSLVHAALSGAQRVGVEKEHLTLGAAETLQAGAGAWQLVDVAGEVRSMRWVKSAGEQDRLGRAAEITDRATEEILARIHVGQSELEAAAMLSAAIGSAGGTLAFESLVQFGPNSAGAHHRPSTRRLAEGDLVLLDFGAAYEGYRADTTRMAVAGEPSERQREIHTLVLRAHDAAIGAVRAGVSAGEVDGAARRVIEQAGMGDLFFHRVGHGLGLEAHEEPSLDPGSKTELAAGMVVTIEPGVYVEGWGGIRIEDDVVVESGGCRVLTNAPRDLHAIAR